jgi:hypothetical protein
MSQQAPDTWGRGICAGLFLGVRRRPLLVGLRPVPAQCTTATALSRGSSNSIALQTINIHQPFVRTQGAGLGSLPGLYFAALHLRCVLTFVRCSKCAWLPVHWFCCSDAPYKRTYHNCCVLWCRLVYKPWGLLLPVELRGHSLNRNIAHRSPIRSMTALCMFNRGIWAVWAWEALPIDNLVRLKPVEGPKHLRRYKGLDTTTTGCNMATPCHWCCIKPSVKR